MQYFLYRKQSITALPEIESASVLMLLERHFLYRVTLERFRFPETK